MQFLGISVDNEQIYLIFRSYLDAVNAKDQVNPFMFDKIALKFKNLGRNLKMVIFEIKFKMLENSLNDDFPIFRTLKKMKKILD